MMQPGLTYLHLISLGSITRDPRDKPMGGAGMHTSHPRRLGAQHLGSLRSRLAGWGCTCVSTVGWGCHGRVPPWLRSGSEQGAGALPVLDLEAEAKGGRAASGPGRVGWAAARGGERRAAG